jgi:hypothetical protein
MDKAGTSTQKQRLLPWRHKAVEALRDVPDTWFYFHLGRMLKEPLTGSTGPRDRPLPVWDCATEVLYCAFALLDPSERSAEGPSYFPALAHSALRSRSVLDGRSARRRVA